MRAALLSIALLCAACTVGSDEAPTPTAEPSVSASPTTSAEPEQDRRGGKQEGTGQPGKKGSKQKPAKSTVPPSQPSTNPRLDLPLIEAAGAGDAERVTTLLRRGAGVRATDAQGRTPLVAAAYGNHVEVARLLVDAGANPNEKDGTVQSAYLIATSEVGDRPRLLRLLLDGGADVSSRDSFNGTGLIRAAERGFPRIVEVLLTTDIDVNHVNRLGWTALHEAIVLGDGGPDHLAVVELLIEAGADVNLSGTGGSPLVMATERGHEEIARALRRAGARA